MRYFCIKYSAEPRVVGDYPQIQSLFSVDIEETSALVINKFQERDLPDEIQLNFVLSENAIPTDLLSGVYFSEFNGLLVSQKLFKIFLDYHLPPYQLIPAQVKIKNVIQPYNWLHFTTDISNVVDYNHTIFTKFDPWTKKREQVSIQSLEEYKKTRAAIKGLAQLKTFEVSLREYKYDILNSRFLWTGILVSETLWRRMVHEGITGLEVFENVSACST